MDLGIPGYEHLVWDVSLVSDRVGSSLQHGLNGKLQLSDYLNARARTKIGKFRRDYAAKNIACSRECRRRRQACRCTCERYDDRRHRRR